MSACRLVATRVSNEAGRLTMRAVQASTSSLSQRTSAKSLATWAAISSHITIAWRWALLLVTTVSSLRGRLRAVPRDVPLSLEVPTLKLAKTVGATERARRALAATRRVLAQLDA